MKIKEPKNQNYAAVVVKIKTIIPLENCTNVQGAIIMGNQVVVSKDIKVGDIGLYFPLECQLSKEYLSNNNLYNKSKLNVDDTKKGYFDENGRIRCQRFRGHKSEGLYMPLNSLEFIPDIKVELGDCFDELHDTPICKKYILKTNSNLKVAGQRAAKISNEMMQLLVDKQFKFHSETGMMYNNLHRIYPDSLIQISYKLHGSSGIVSNVLIKKHLKWYEKILLKIGINIPTEEYGFIYSSGKPKSNLPKGIIGKWKNKNIDYYTSDIWKESYEKLKDFVEEGMSLYFEIVGFTSTGSAIQKDYDYGQASNTFGIYIYRVTYTNSKGKTFELSAKQVQDFCKKNGLNAVPELYYGYAKDLFTFQNLNDTSDDAWRDEFLAYIKFKYNEKDCYMCSTTQPEEGVVIRIEGNDFEAYKAKSERFYARETAQLDKGESNIEDEN